MNLRPVNPLNLLGHKREEVHCKVPGNIVALNTTRLNNENYPSKPFDPKEHFMAQSSRLGGKASFTKTNQELTVYFKRQKMMQDTERKIERTNKREDEKTKKKNELKKIKQQSIDMQIRKKKEGYLKTLERKIEIEQKSYLDGKIREEKVYEKIRNAEKLKELKDLSKIQKRANAGLRVNEFVIKNGVILKPKSLKQKMVEQVSRDSSSSERSSKSEQKATTSSIYDDYEPIPFSVE